MRIIKPQHLSVMHRVFERRQRAYLCVSVIAFTRLQDTPNLLPEQDMWRELAPLLGPTPLDVSLPKTGAEYLVVGNAHAPAGTTAQGLKVSVSLGGLTKTLHVFGERCWTGGRPSDPVPFDAVPLTWARAFGGADQPSNPDGIGRAPQSTPRGSLHFLPQVEYPQHPSASPGRPIPAAAFAPIPPTWPARKRFDGTYDDAWLAQDYPGSPCDMNWRYFCVAPEDQWQPQSFAGNEQIELVHLNAAHPQLNATLPGIRPVVAVRRKAMPPDAARFLEPALDTVWLFPNQLRAALVWHALLPVADEFASEVELLAVGADWLNASRPREHMLQAIAARLDKDHGALRSLEDADLLPEGLATPNDAMQRFEKLLGNSGVALQRHQDKVCTAQAVLEQTLTEKLGAAVVQALAQERDALARDLGMPGLDAVRNASPQDLLALAGTLPTYDPMHGDLRTRHSVNRAALRDAAVAAGAGTSILDAALGDAGTVLRPPQQGLLAIAENTLAQAAVANPNAALSTLDPAMKAMLERADAIAPLHGALAHLTDAPAPLAPARQALLRDGAIRAKAVGKRFAGKDLTGADFSGLDLQDVDFSGATLNGVKFNGAQLAGANFAKASLARACFADASTDGAMFAGANLGKAAFERTSLRGCDFTDATLEETRFEQVDLDGSRFAGTSWLRTRLYAARCQRADMRDAQFIGCYLLGSDFSHADVTAATFIECALNKAVFVQSALGRTVFVTCGLDGADFSGAEAERVCFLHGCSARKAVFASARFLAAAFRGLALEASVFDGALLDGADFSEARCAKARFAHASMTGALLLKTDLAGATLAFANLKDAMMQHADLRGADLTGAHLFAADLARIEVDDATRRDRAIHARARTLPARKVLAPEPLPMARAA